MERELSQPRGSPGHRLWPRPPPQGWHPCQGAGPSDPGTKLLLSGEVAQDPPLHHTQRVCSPKPPPPPGEGGSGGHTLPRPLNSGKVTQTRKNVGGVCWGHEPCPSSGNTRQQRGRGAAASPLPMLPSPPGSTDRSSCTGPEIRYKSDKLDHLPHLAQLSAGPSPRLQPAQGRLKFLLQRAKGNGFSFLARFQSFPSAQHLQLLIGSESQRPGSHRVQKTSAPGDRAKG